MKFSKRVVEQNQLIQREVFWQSELGEWDIVMNESESSGLQITAWHRGVNHLRLGIVTLRPRSVTDLEEFAAISGELFKQIVVGLRDLGRDDLRSDQERKMDDMETLFRSGNFLKSSE